MDVWTIIAVVFFVIFIIVMLVLAARNMNHGYTIGSGMFKSSDDNLEKDKHLDPADYNYYDKDGKKK